jgi:hypothetical protein
MTEWADSGLDDAPVWNVQRSAYAGEASELYNIFRGESIRGGEGGNLRFLRLEL